MIALVVGWSLILWGGYATIVGIQDGSSAGFLATLLGAFTVMIGIWIL